MFKNILIVLLLATTYFGLGVVGEQYLELEHRKGREIYLLDMNCKAQAEGFKNGQDSVRQQARILELGVYNVNRDGQVEFQWVPAVPLSVLIDGGFKLERLPKSEPKKDEGT